MARGALSWTLDDLAEASGVSRRTVAKFEAGEPVGDLLQTKLKAAFEAKHVRFVEDGPFKGAMIKVRRAN